MLTARGALGTLEIESQPILLAEVDNTDEKPAFQFAVKASGKHLMAGPVERGSKGCILRIRVRNIGRGPAFNVKPQVAIRDALNNFVPTTTPLFVQGLRPGDSAVFLIQNDSPTAVVTTIASATMGSVTNPGEDTPVTVYLSSAFPMPLG